jgi:hypothetical protein
MPNSSSVANVLSSISDNMSLRLYESIATGLAPVFLVNYEIRTKRGRRRAQYT